MVLTLNIKSGMPAAEDAIGRMRTALALARRNGVELVRLVHGYGSTGVGGTLRMECRTCLERLVAGGRILRYVHGDDYTFDRAAILGWLERHPELRKTLPSDSHNPGITFVVLAEGKKSVNGVHVNGTQPLAKKRGIIPLPSDYRGTTPTLRVTPPREGNLTHHSPPAEECPSPRLHSPPAEGCPKGGVVPPGNIASAKPPRKGNPASPRTTPPQKRTAFTKTGKDFGILKNISSRRPPR